MIYVIGNKENLVPIRLTKNNGEHYMCCLFSICTLIIGLGEPSQYKGLHVEVSTPRPIWGTNEDPVVLLIFSNGDSKSFAYQLPSKWYSDVFDICSFYKDVSEQDNRRAFSQNRIGGNTVLAPGERVTFAYHLSTHVQLELLKGPKRNGLYKVLLRQFGDVRGGPVFFTIADKTPETELGIKEIAHENDVQVAAAIMGLKTTTSEARFQLLKIAQKKFWPEYFWRLLVVADDAYAVVTTLEKLRPAWLTPSRVAQEGLFRLIHSKDLAIRRAAIRTLERLGKDENMADKLAFFLKTQRDGPTLDYGRKTLLALRGQKELRVEETGKGRLIELSTPQPLWPIYDEPVILLSVTNADEKLYKFKLPYVWYKKVPDIFSVYGEDEKLGLMKVLDNPQPFSWQQFDKKTVLGPGEKVTFAFRISSIAKLPERRALAGRYIVQLMTFEDYGTVSPSFLGRPLFLWIANTGPTMNGFWGEIIKEEDVIIAIIRVKLPTTTSQDKATILWHALNYCKRSGKKEALWQLLKLVEEDAYAVVETLEGLPSEMIDEGGLFRHLHSKDLAIRRAAIRALRHLGPNTAAAKRLETFLKNQQDQPVLEYGQETLMTLRGKKTIFAPPIRPPLSPRASFFRGAPREIF